MVAALLLLSATPNLAQGVCGDLVSSYGPYDYRRDRDKLKVVEDYHFNADVEFLRRGMSTVDIGGDIAYVLGTFPNHHRALRAMDMLGRKEKATKVQGAKYSVECYFDRAIRFAKDDAMVRMLYGMHLIARDRKKEGLEQLRAAESLGASSANFHYNLGLAYFDVGHYDSSLEHAKKAYDLGFPLPGLKDKLKRAGKWR
jgi:tetratricopeptide (TPR) repeat protein